MSRAGARYRRRTTARKLLERRTVCQICHRRKSQTIDHRVPMSQGGVDDASNWQAVCIPCHERKSKREQMAWLRSPVGRAACVKGGKVGGRIVGQRKAAAALARWGTSSPKGQKRAYYLANREYENAKSRAHYAANREYYREYMRRWRAANPDYARERYAKEQRRKGLLVKRYAKRKANSAGLAS